MTELRYLPDSDDVTEFTATVRSASEDSIVLDGTFFYPEGGGQPADYGVIEWDGGRATIVGAWKDHGDVCHDVGDLDGDVPDPGTVVEARIDASRRSKLSRMHTAQHVVSRVVLDEYGAATAGNQVDADRSWIEFDPASFDASDLETIERRANDAIGRDPNVIKAERPRPEVEAVVEEGRARLDLIPDHVDPLRVVEIDGFDYCPCGGTHVDSLGEIGEIELVGQEPTSDNGVRITFELVD